jgi:hypothetical protein
VQGGVPKKLTDEYKWADLKTWMQFWQDGGVQFLQWINKLKLEFLLNSAYNPYLVLSDY